MTHLIAELSTRVRDEDGTVYAVRVHGDERDDGTWAGWLEFEPQEQGRPALRTDEETSQPSRVTLEYWATGLEAVYLAGALDRARGRLSTGLASERLLT